MRDITQLILDDHETFRREFAALDDACSAEELEQVWGPLAALLDVHAAAEEAIFYPELIRRGDDPEEETLDAVRDHNDIRDGMHDAARHPVGSAAWWEAVRRARVANSNHMAEEEDGALPDFRRHADSALRELLAERFRDFKAEHEGSRELDTTDKDPEAYVSTVEAEVLPGSTDPSSERSSGSLDIGSLKGR